MTGQLSSFQIKTCNQRNGQLLVFSMPSQPRHGHRDDRLNNPVSVSRGQRLNRVTSLIYRSQPMLTRWDYGRFYELFWNLSTKTLCQRYFKFKKRLLLTYFLTLSQINSKNYHFHTFFCAQTDKAESIWKLCHQFERRKTMKIIKFVLDLTWSKEVGRK